MKQMKIQSAKNREERIITNMKNTFEFIDEKY